jgi:hypothetical protein
MDILNRLLSVLGTLLLWVSSALVIEEMTFGGLARLLLSLPYEARDRRRSRQAFKGTSTQQVQEARNTELQRGTSC